ncbi:Bromodomain-containing protein [Saccharata proteae CBS 121410]|uniref:Bromodomain-containing protein n=1 Tax=Saccharata proteae CBS 121410 TaxID=1314787 RepID=A0A9P4HW63_9PEZI|nr:Bromodomain-containing protein [Saccharata proteae CBS 121410]
MAVMTEPAMDNASPEQFKQPILPADPPASDGHTNGTESHTEDLTAASAANAEAHLTNGQHEINGDAIATELPATEPLTNMTSDVAPAASLFGDPSADATSLPPAPDNLATTSQPPAIEPAISDLRDQTIAPRSENAEQPDSAEHNATSNETTDTKESEAQSGDAMDTAADAQAPGAETDLVDRTAAEAAKEATDVAKTDEPTESVPPPPPAQSSLDHPAAATDETSQPQTAPAVADTDMPDAPSARVRPREEDDDMEPQAKRAKTDSSASPPRDQASPSKDQASQSTGQETQPKDEESKQPDAPASDAGPKKYDDREMTNAQHKFLLDRVRGAKKTKPAVPFLYPVDPVALNIPTYPQIVPKPMDLGTIENRLKNKAYTSVDNFMADFYLMIDNCLTFNGPQHPVTQSAWNLQLWFERGMHTMPERTAAAAEQPKKKKLSAPSTSNGNKARRESRVAHSPPTNAPAAVPFALQADGTPIIRRDSSTGDGRPKREIHRPPPRDLPYSNPRPKNKKSQLELKFAEQVVTELFKPKYMAFAFPFYSPVDPVALNIPQYLKIIKKPMDLGTIQSRLKNGEYSSAKDVKSDIELMLHNCYKFNPETDDVHRMGKQVDAVYRKLWQEKQKWLDDHLPVSENHSPATSDLEEDESEEEDDEEEIRQRQEQIAQQIMALTQEQLALQKKRNSPAGVKKKSAKTAKTAGKTKKVISKPAPPAKKKKQRAITFEEKRLISETIGSLAEREMARAVQIIRNGVPELQAVNDDELELDIDAIPNDVLHDLLKYIRTIAPSAMPAPQDDDYEPPSRSNKPASSHPRKNKPMGKDEQEAAIAAVRRQLQGFTQGSSDDQSPEPAAPAHQAESSDEDSSEAESEEE